MIRSRVTLVGGCRCGSVDDVEDARTEQSVRKQFGPSSGRVLSDERHAELSSSMPKPLLEAFRCQHRRAGTMDPQQCRRSTQHVNAHNTHDNQTSRSTNASLRKHQAAPRRQRTHASAERGWTNTGQQLTCRSAGPLFSTRMSMARVRKRPWHASTTNCCAASRTRRRLHPCEIAASLAECLRNDASQS